MYSIELESSRLSNRHQSSVEPEQLGSTREADFQGKLLLAMRYALVGHPGQSAK